MVTPQAAESANATTLDGSTTSATLELFRAALGPLNTDYYLKAFTRFDAADRAGPSWNWAASLCTLNWMALRQLWGAALTYTGLVFAAILFTFGIGRLVFQWSSEVQMALLAAWVAIAFAVPGVFGNALLYAACRKKMERALAVNATLDDACAMLRREATSRQRLIGLGIGNAILAAALVGGYLTFSGMDLPGSGTQNLAQTRKEAVGKARELPVEEVISPVPAASSVIEPAPVASAPLTTPSAPQFAASALATLSAPASAPTPPAVLAATPQAPAETGAAAPKPAAPTAKAPAPQASAKAASIPPKEKDKKKDKALAEKAKAAAAKAAAAASSTREPRFLINVGLFADENNARNVYTKLSDAGLNVLSNELNGKKGKMTRVRVGPFATQAEADQAADKVRSLQLEAVVVPQ